MFDLAFKNVIEVHRSRIKSPDNCFVITTYAVPLRKRDMEAFLSIPTNASVLNINRLTL